MVVVVQPMSKGNNEKRKRFIKFYSKSITVRFGVHFFVTPFRI